MKKLTLALLLTIPCWAAIGTPVDLTPITAGGANTQSVSYILSTGELLSCSAGWNDSTKTLSTFTWNGIALSQDIAPQTGGAGKHTLYSLYISSGATANLTITLSGIATIIVKCLRVTGITSTSWTDKTAATATGTTTSPSSGATATLSQADELVIGAFYRVGSTVGGTWSNSFTDINTSASGANGVNNTGYLIVSSTSAVTAAKTGATSATYSAMVVTYKGAAAATTPNLFTMLGAGR